MALYILVQPEFRRGFRQPAVFWERAVIAAWADLRLAARAERRPLAKHLYWTKKSIHSEPIQEGV